MIESKSPLDPCMDWLERVLCFPCRLCCKENETERLPTVVPEHGQFKPRPTSTGGEPTTTQPTAGKDGDVDHVVPERDGIKPRPWPDESTHPSKSTNRFSTVAFELKSIL